MYSRYIATAAVIIAVATASTTPPALADAQAAFDSAQYRSCLQKVAAAFAGPASESTSPARYDRLGSRIEEMCDLANESTIVTSGPTDCVTSRDLTSAERDELKSITQALQQIEQVAREGRRINRRLGGTGDVGDVILANCSDQKQRDQEAYDRKD